MTRRTPLVLVALMAFAACVPPAESDEPEGSEEPADYEEVPDDGKADGVPATFDQNNLVGSDLFLDDGSFTAAEMQRFLEQSPYGTRSWLADYVTPAGRTAAVAIVASARAEGIHPIMLLSRMQVEATLVSRTTTPSATRINSALGCACPDGGGCSRQYRGLEAQLTCGAETLRRWYDASVDGTGQWRRGVQRRTLDDRRVTPANHATASLYQYTPWVLPNRGGGWLVWNVTKKYARHAVNEGYIPASTPQR